jgi:hypothetical protein
MSFTERIVEPIKLNFGERNEYVLIGKNLVTKEVYLANQKVFDSIIKSGDVAWNDILNNNDITKFLVKLSSNKVAILNHSDSLVKECKGENMKMNDLAKQEEVKSGFDNIPVGMTKLKADSIDIEPVEVEFNGVKKTRYDLTAKTTDGKEVHFGCGVKVYNGLIQASKVPNIKVVYITRNGTTKEDTTYTVASD